MARRKKEVRVHLQPGLAPVAVMHVEVDQRDAVEPVNRAATNFIQSMYWQINRATQRISSRHPKESICLFLNPKKTK